MKKVVLLSYHYYPSARRAGFHWLADAYHQLGWQVTFVTAPLSYLHKLSSNFRFDYPVQAEANRLIQERDNFFRYVFFTKIHPGSFRNRLLNRLATPLFTRYSDISFGNLEPVLKQADHIIFESTPAIMLLPKIHRLNPQARCIYRVSDDIRLLKLHPVVIKSEDLLAPQFDVISAPSGYIYNHFKHLPNAHLQFHGIQKDHFDEPYLNPFQNQWNAVFVGNHPYLDWHFINTVAEAFPHFTIHIIGNVGNQARRSNIQVYGQLPFRETIPFLQHANIGLHPVNYTEGAESATDTLKVQQYSYCGLPIIMPEFIRSQRENSFFYQPEDEASIKTCFQQAIDFRPDVVRLRQPINSWQSLATGIINTAESTRLEKHENHFI